MLTYISCKYLRVKYEYYFVLKIILIFKKDICLKTFEELNFDRSHSCPECRSTEYQKYNLAF